MASATASERLRAPSFSNACRSVRLTVVSLMAISCAISQLGE